MSMSAVRLAVGRTYEFMHPVGDAPIHAMKASTMSIDHRWEETILAEFGVVSWLYDQYN